MLTGIAARELVLGGTMIGLDTATFFYPVYSALGNRLMAGDVPGWNPHQFSGAPFAADPESGWTYLPAMILFAILPLTAAVKAWLVFHLLLPGVTTYLLGRVLGLGPLGALGAAVAYEFSGLVYGRNVSSPAYTQMTAWIPALILATELAIRSQTWPARLRWWSMAGLSLSQIVATWIGQGSYYALLALGGYVAYRTLFSPPSESPRLGRRVAGLVLHGGAVLTIVLALAAAGILPRLEFHARSNLAEGYTGASAWAAVLGGWDLRQTIEQVLGRSFIYAGGATLLLAGLGLLVAGRRHAAPFFAALSIGALVLAQRQTTPIHALLYATLPRFEELHRHWPERAMVVFYLGPALLAGAAIHGLSQGAKARGRLIVAGVGILLAVIGAAAAVASVAPEAWASALIAGVGTVALMWMRGRVVRGAISVVLIATVFVDLFVVGRYNLAHGLFGGFAKVDLDEYYDGGRAAAFLQARQDEEPARFFGYGPERDGPPESQRPPYRYAYAEPEMAALLVNNRATILGLQDVQGYNPLQLQRYVEYVAALNGFVQEYHEANVYPRGLESPLVDLLNARYVVVPRTTASDRVHRFDRGSNFRVVDDGDRSRVLENTEALPRAWIVHAAKRVDRGGTLAALTSGGVDPRRIALLEVAPPPVAEPADPAADRVVITTYEPDRIRLTATTGAPGLLVMSEIYYPAWRAYVDGQPAPLYIANHILRAIPVPAGEHVVELRYESRALAIGLAVSVGTAGVLVILAAAGWWPRLARMATGPARRGDMRERVAERIVVERDIGDGEQDGREASSGARPWLGDR